MSQFASIRRSLVGEYRDFTLVAAGALLTLAGSCVNLAYQSRAQEQALQATDRRDMQKDAAALVNEVFRFADSVDFRSQRVLEVVDGPSDSLLGARIDEYDKSVTDWIAAEPRFLALSQTYFDSATAYAIAANTELYKLTLDTYRAMLASRKSREAYGQAKTKVTDKMVMKSPKSVREYLVAADSLMAEDERKMQSQLQEMRRLDMKGRATSIRLHRTLLMSIRSGLVGLSGDDRQDLQAFIRADSTNLGRLGYDLGLYPFSWWFVARLIAWAAFAFVCGRLARKLQRSEVRWSVAGFFFGPFALVALIILKRPKAAVAQ